MVKVRASLRRQVQLCDIGISPASDGALAEVTACILLVAFVTAADLLVNDWLSV